MCGLCGSVNTARFLVHSSIDSQADQVLDQQRHSAGSNAKICAPWLAFSRAKGGVQQNWRRQELSVLCTLGCKSGCSTTRKRVSNPGTV